MNNINQNYLHTFLPNRNSDPCTNNSSRNGTAAGFQQLINDIQETQAALRNNTNQLNFHDSSIQQQPFHDFQGYLIILARILIAEILGKEGRVDLDFSDSSQNNNRVFTAQELITDAEKLAGLR